MWSHSVPGLFCFSLGLGVAYLEAMVSPIAGSHEFLLPTGGVRQTSTPATVLSQKQYKKEEERIIRELQFVSKYRNELRDCLLYVMEGSMKKRSALF